MNVFDTKHNYSVQESYILIPPPQSLGKVSWIFKDQDYQHSSLSEKVFLSPPLPPQPPQDFFFSYLSEI